MVSVRRRFRRPQHVVFDEWRRFDNPLKRKAGVKLENLPKFEEYGMQLTETAPIKSAVLRKVKSEWEKSHGKKGL